MYGILKQIIQKLKKILTKFEKIVSTQIILNFFFIFEHFLVKLWKFSKYKGFNINLHEDKKIKYWNSWNLRQVLWNFK